MREIALDTETTGINPNDGHRIIEIGAIELMHHLPTGQKLHLYINPERNIDDGAVAIHGITTEFLADKPVFADIVDEFLAFIGTDLMVIHNANFDMGFINAELKRLDRPILSMNQSIDTLLLARKKFPGAQANVNALCRRLEINNAHRDLHGALVDADLLASVYVELLGGLQPGLLLDTELDQTMDNQAVTTIKGQDLKLNADTKTVRFIRAHSPTINELEAHNIFLEGLENPVWKRR